MRVFLSFSHDENPIARRIIERCRSKGIDALNKDLQLATHGKSDVIEEIIREVRNYDLVVLLWSKSFEVDNWLQKELFALLTVHRERLQQFIYTVLVDDTPLPSTLEQLGSFNYSDAAEGNIDDLIASLPNHNHVFAVMMFGDAEMDSAYELAIKPVAEDFGFNVTRIDQIGDSEGISPQILQHIEGSAIVLCDLTGERPNVYFETGYALALRKEIILTAKAGAIVHFDLRDRRTIFWTTAADLKRRLSERFTAILQRRHEFRSTPLS